MPSINLAPGTQHIIIARKRRQRLYLITIAVVAIFVAGYFGLLMYSQVLETQSEDIKAEIQVIDQSIQALREDATRVALFEKRLVDVATLLDSHVSWAKVLTDLERLMPADTVLTKLEATKDSASMSVQGRTSNVDQVALALASLTAGPNHPSVFTRGVVENILRQEASEASPNPSYSFTMNLEFDPAALKAAPL